VPAQLILSTVTTIIDMAMLAMALRSGMLFGFDDLG
jgi:hypothetical protein